jgi:putative SOS response-associated peptidase YedK
MEQMCGRYILTVTGQVIADFLELDEAPEDGPRFNIAPTQTVPIVRAAAGGGRELAHARWGLIPRWAKEIGIGARLINARAETVASKPSFRSAFRRRRCLVPADGFFEWTTTPGGKQPHLIRYEDRRLFAFAGLWERWSTPDGGEVESCTIITTRPNRVVAPIHDRMPVILARDDHDRWIHSEETVVEELGGLLAPCPAEGMEIFPVDRRVNSPRNDDPLCVEPSGLYSR